ncbi:MAG: hypothetical protein U5N53_12855 [Mycobacterium sp.]|nr:hypothetical protein [Mycobacterium sp.]
MAVAWYDANQLDGFFAWVLVFILLLVFADLILGPVGRHRLGDTMAQIEIQGLVKEFTDRRDVTRVIDGDLTITGETVSVGRRRGGGPRPRCSTSRCFRYRGLDSVRLRSAARCRRSAHFQYRGCGGSGTRLVDGYKQPPGMAFSIDIVRRQRCWRRSATSAAQGAQTLGRSARCDQAYGGLVAVRLRRVLAYGVHG